MASLKFSELNGCYEISHEGRPYIWKLPTGSAMIIIAGVDLRSGTSCLKFSHPNLLARFGRAFEYKHYLRGGGKRWTAHPGLEFWFAIPLDQIELIPEPGYSYVKVRINGHEFMLNVGGGGGSGGWSDCVLDTAMLCGTKKTNNRLLHVLGNVSLPPNQVEHLEVRKPEERDQLYFEQLVAKLYGSRHLESWCWIQLENGYSYNGENKFRLERREVGRGERATQNLLCCLGVDSRVRVKISQVDWLKTAELNHWVLPKFEDMIYSASGCVLA